MKKINNKFLKIGLPLLGVATLAIAVPFALTACTQSKNASSTTSSKNNGPLNTGANAIIPGAGNISSSFDEQSNLWNNSLKNKKGYVFQNNQHNNVNIADLASVINYNEIQNMYKILNNPKMQSFMKWLSTKKVIVVDAQIPNPAWTRVPSVSPGNVAKQIKHIQSDFVLCTPQLYPILYTSPQNKELPGFGMQMAMPSNQANINVLMDDWKGEIIAHQKGVDDYSLFQAMQGSADVVIYLYPGTSDWITQNLSMAQEALKPLLTTNSAFDYTKAIIPITLAQGFDSLNSPIGLMYLFQSLLNGKGYSQSTDGQWSQNNSLNWKSSLANLYQSQNQDAVDLQPFLAYVNQITPYFELIQTFGLDLVADGYAEKGKKAIFPFAEKYIHTLNGPSNGGSQNKTLSAYFNDTSMLLALGFTPYYSTYIIDPGQSAVPNIKNGIVLPDYVKNIYPNLIATSINNSKDGQTVPVKQSKTGIWQHHVDPKPMSLMLLNVGTVLADDWLMPKTSTIYSAGNPIINHIIYNSQGDYTLNAEAFFTSNNKSALFNSSTPAPNKISYFGFMPANLMDKTINGEPIFDSMVNNSTTGIDGQQGNAIMDDFMGFQWFANQLEFIHQNEFQIPKITYYYAGKTLNFNNINLSYWNWNIDPNILNNDGANQTAAFSISKIHDNQRRLLK